MKLDESRLESVITRRINTILSNDKSLDAVIQSLVDKIIDEALLKDVTKIALKSLADRD